MVDQPIDDDDDDGDDDDDDDLVDQPIAQSSMVSASVVRSCNYPGCSFDLQLNPCTKQSCQNVLHHLCGQKFTGEKGMYQEDDANDPRPDQSHWCFHCNSITNTNVSSTTVSTAAFPFGHIGTLNVRRTDTQAGTLSAESRRRSLTDTSTGKGTVTSNKRRWKF